MPLLYFRYLNIGNTLEKINILFEKIHISSENLPVNFIFKYAQKEVNGKNLSFNTFLDDRNRLLTAGPKYLSASSEVKTRPFDMKINKGIVQINVSIPDVKAYFFINALLRKKHMIL